MSIAASDGLNFAPRVLEPESALVAGMAAPAPRKAVQRFSGAVPLFPDTSGPGPTAIQEPPSWIYDFNPATGSARATFLGEVAFTSGGSGSAGVTTWNGRAGTVTLTTADLAGAGGAPLLSPVFTGNPQAPTPTPGDADTSIATTAFVAQAIVANPIVQSFNGRTGAVTLNPADVTNAGGAPANSPALTGVPTTPTAAQGTQSGQIASTQFVANAIAGGTVTTWNGRQGAVSLTLSDVQSVGGAPIASPSFTGVPAVPTAAPGTATTQAASTAFVTNAVVAASSGVASFNTRTGAVTLQTADVVAAGGAPIVSPNMTGTPTAPTPTGGDNSTKVATTAFVGAAIAGITSGVSTFNGRSGTVTLQLADVTSVGGAPIASPIMTGTPTAPTPTGGDNSTKLATTAFVAATIVPPSSTTPVMDGTAAIGAATTYARADHVHPTDTSRYAASNPANYQTAAQVNAAIAAIVPVLAIKTFGSSGTYTPTPGMTCCIIECVGGGAGGSGVGGTTAQYNIGAGGGAGSYARKLATAAQIGASQAVTVGAGGGGGGMNAAGGPGGNTSVGTLCIAIGAPAGSGVYAGGNPGTGGTGDLTLNGAPGQNGVITAQASASVGGGAGGAAPMMGGASNQSMWTATSATGGGSWGPGGGGGGGSIGTTGGAAGGAGGGGIVIITEFG